MTRRYLVLSDLHLCDVEEHADGWKAYKGRRYVFDRELDGLVNRFVSEGPPEAQRVLVLNGDIIDFDLVTAVPEEPPWPVSGRERRRGLAATEEKSVWKLRRVLEAHSGFVDTLARFVGGGGDVVYVAGNHDPELAFPGVQETFLRALRDRAAALGLPFRPGALTFERWFYLVPGEIYVEHGQQYDFYTSFRNVLSPILDDGRIALPMGNLSNRYLMSQIGFFNPHASDYILNIYRYALHWLRHYAFSRRSMLITWLTGSLLVLGRLLRIKHAMQKASRRDGGVGEEALLADQAARYGLPLGTVRVLDGLKKQPIMYRVFRVLREFWIDRALLGLLMIAGTVLLALAEVPLWVKLMVPLSAFPLAFFVYEELAHGETIFSAEADYPHLARRIAALLDVKVVTFGHSHEPLMQPLGGDATYVNTGTWAPIFAKGCPERSLAAGYRNALFFAVDGDGRSELRFESLLPLEQKLATDPAQRRLSGQRQRSVDPHVAA